MKRYVKFSGDNCLLGNFTRGKAYEVESTEKNDFGAYVMDDYSIRALVLIKDVCGYLTDKESWVFCDENGNTDCTEKHDSQYKGQFELANGDVVAKEKGKYSINITQELKRIAAM